jgi:hypothetical protein
MAQSRFMIASKQRSGTHFVRAVLSTPSSLVWDEWRSQDASTMNCMHGCGAADVALNWTEQLDRLFGERATAISARRCAARTSLSPEWSITGDDQPKSPSCCDCGCAGATWRGTVCGNRENQPVEAVGLIWQGNHGWADPLRNGLNLATSIPYLRAHAVRIVMLECARRIDSDACSEGGRASDPSACMRRSHRRLNTLAWALADSSIEVHARLLATGLHVDDAAKLLLERTISNLARLHGKFDAAFERFGGAGVPIVHVAYERLTQDYGTHIHWLGTSRVDGRPHPSHASRALSAGAFAQLLTFVGVRDVVFDAATSTLRRTRAPQWAVPVGNGSKHSGHSLAPIDRIKHAGWLNHSLARGDVVPCMLTDTCRPVPPLRFRNYEPPAY